MTRIVGGRCVFPLSPTSRGYTKLGECCAEMENCDLKVLSVKADFGEISGGKGRFCPKTRKVGASNGHHRSRFCISKRHVRELFNDVVRHFWRRNCRKDENVGGPDRNCEIEFE